MSQPIHDTIKPEIKAKRFDLTWEMIESLQNCAISVRGGKIEVFVSYSNEKNRDARTALEIILQCRTFAPGVFERGENGKWQRAGKYPEHAGTEGC